MVVLGLLGVASCTAAFATTETTPAPRGLPQRFEASFTLKSLGATVARTHWTLSPLDDGRYVYESRSETSGVMAWVSKDNIVERSEWRYHDDALRPLSYSYRRDGRKSRRVAVAFDWDKRVARNTTAGATWQMPIPEGTLDKLNYLLAMMRDLADGKRDIRYQVADGGRLKSYRLLAVGNERLTTELGRLDTVVIRRLREGKRRETTLWCAPSLRYLPVRIEHRERDGVDVLLAIDSVRGLP